MDGLVAGTWLLRLVLLGTLAVGVRRNHASIVTNALVGLVATALPFVVDLALDVSGVPASIERLVPFWIALAAVLHMVGMLGWYESTWWWDHVTHLVSAALIAAVFAGLVHGYALVSPAFDPTPAVLAGLTVLGTLAVGVVWELIELAIHRYSTVLGVESVLIPYGARDTALDLVFDVLGAVVVVGFDVRVLVPVIVEVPWLTRLLLLLAGAYLVAGSLGSVLVLLLVSPRPDGDRP